MEEKQFVSFLAEPELAVKARVAASMRNESRSELIRRALERELARLAVNEEQKARNEGGGR